MRKERGQLFRRSAQVSRVFKLILLPLPVEVLDYDPSDMRSVRSKRFLGKKCHTLDVGVNQLEVVRMNREQLFRILVWVTWDQLCLLVFAPRGQQRELRPHPSACRSSNPLPIELPSRSQEIKCSVA